MPRSFGGNRLTYARPTSPKFYTDTINWNKINGQAKGDILTDRSGVYNSGSDKYDLFDLNPQNVASFDTSANTTTHIVIGIDLGAFSHSIDYVAVMNHNLNTAEGAIRIAHSASPITTAGGGTEVANASAILNAAVGGGTVIEPDDDGDTLYSFDASTDRYWSLEIEDITNFSATDLFIGSVMLGEMYSLPHAPDLNIVHSFSVDGANITESVGGKRHSNPRWIKANSSTVNVGNYIPFRLAAGALQIPGRERYSISYSTVTDTDIFPSDLSSILSETFIADVFSKTAWHVLPFIMSIDEDSTTEGDYIYCRFMDKSLSVTQIAYKTYTFAFGVEQEF